MKNVLLFSLFLAITSNVFSQNKYYKAKDGKIIDKQAYEEHKNKLVTKLQAVDPKFKVYEDLKLLYQNKDSIVYFYSLNFSNEKPKKLKREKKSKKDIIGKEFPLANLKTIDGKPISVADLKGKATLVNFWFTACKPCIDEIPALNKMKEKYGDKFNFIAITFNKSSMVSKFLKKHKFNFTHISGAKSITKKLKLRAFPVNMFLDKNGIVRQIEGNIPYTHNEQNKLIAGDGKEFIEILQKLSLE